MAAQIDTLDLIVLTFLLAGTVAYLSKGSLWGKDENPYGEPLDMSMHKKQGQLLELINGDEDKGVTKKNCIIFFGSQTGTAEDYASRFYKDGRSRFKLDSIAANLEDYSDYESLAAVPESTIVVFIMATYGEGEPTDNAADFHAYLTELAEAAKDDPDSPSLANLRYAIFGLGNSTYEKYNFIATDVDEKLQSLGARRVGKCGQGDDGQGTTEEAFIAWKEDTWADLKGCMDLTEHAAVYEAQFEVTETDGHDDESVYQGEPNKGHLRGTPFPTIDALNPGIASVSQARELFSDEGRNCLHIDIDIRNLGVKYSTGDHVAVLPSNSSAQVDLFLTALGLIDRRHQVIELKPTAPTVKVPFPTPTTYDAVARYYLAICDPLSQQFVADLAQFAPDSADGLAETLKQLGHDSQLFKKQVIEPKFNLAQFMLHMSNGEQWSKVNFSLIVENLHRIQPRYYSISSSSEVLPSTISITTVVESVEAPEPVKMVKGVATNYLLALKKTMHKEKGANPARYALEGPRSRYESSPEPKLLIYTRPSHFKMPKNSSKPIVMVGPGTGVAPFRGFMQERLAQYKKLAAEGKEGSMGKAILFFGCRDREKDYLYRSEWEECKRVMGDKFDIYTTFSREGKEKKYVQHLMKEKSDELKKLFTSKVPAYFYVCGDAGRMARDVSHQLDLILGEGSNGVHQLRAEKRYLEDVWS